MTKSVVGTLRAKLSHASGEADPTAKSKLYLTRPARDLNWAVIKSNYQQVNVKAKAFGYADHSCHNLH